ncbi:hypothetical protein Tcan_11229 [Toxocara canis]|nr:hypothetical protein Tcan_11229 [Toxocara canis]
MFWLTNAKRQNQLGVLGRFAPSPSFNLVYRRTVERHLMQNNFRRGTLADPTCMQSEKALADMHSNCFLLVPLMPLCRSMKPNSRMGLSSTDRQIIIHAQ